MCYLIWHDYPSLVEGESHGILYINNINLQQIRSVLGDKECGGCFQNMNIVLLVNFHDTNSYTNSYAGVD